MSTLKISSSLAMLMLLILSVSDASSTSLGVSGNVYPIAERDALEEIEEKAANIDWSKHLGREKWTERFKAYMPPHRVALYPAKEDRTFLVDMSYTLPFDIPDGRGGILYPAGFTFNPLEYIPYSKTIVVIDGADEDELEWFAGSEYSKRLDTVLLLTGGPWYELSARLTRAVFYLTSRVAKRFRLARTPSVVRRKDNRYMEVKEFYVVDKTRAH